MTVDPAEITARAGVRVRLPIVTKIVQAKLINPAASQLALAAITGYDKGTVFKALSTPYAQKIIEASNTLPVNNLVTQIRQDAGDSVVYLGSSVRRGLTELPKPNPKAHILTNARESALAYARHVIPERVQVEISGLQDAFLGGDEDLPAGFDAVEALGVVIDEGSPDPSNPHPDTTQP